MKSSKLGGWRLLTNDEYLSEESDEEKPVIFIRQQGSRWLAFASFFTSFVLGVITTTLVFASMYKGWHRHQTYSLAKTDALPSVPFETITFEADPIFSQKSSEESDWAWNKVLPEGRGYVFVPDSKLRGLAPGQETADGEIYSVAMYHQLHCLARIRKMYWIFQDAVITDEQAIARAHAGRTPSAHVQHCFDYLRQSLQCNGDLTLEWPKQDGPSSGVAVDGWGVPHTCKSPRAIHEYMDKYHFNASVWFDAAG